MRRIFTEKDTYVLYLGGAAVLILFFIISRFNYLLFHALAEIFIIVIASCIFLIAWHSRTFSENSYLKFVGIAYLFVAFFDFLHTLAYKGMGIFPVSGSNLATQLWITARNIESISLLVAPFFSAEKDSHICCNRCVCRFSNFPVTLYFQFPPVSRLLY